MSLPAGAELDRLVFERVMGGFPKGLSHPEAYWQGFYEDGGHGHWSSNIAHAWEVVERLTSCGHVVIVKGDGLRTGDNPRWTVLIDNHPRVDADTAPLAIALAALAAVGHHAG